MYCPSTILINSKLLWIHLKTDGDFNYKRHIPWTNWINPTRYEIGIGENTNGTRLLVINKKWKYFR